MCQQSREGHLLDRIKKFAIFIKNLCFISKLLVFYKNRLNFRTENLNL